MNLEITRQHYQMNEICKIASKKYNAIRVGYDKEGTPLLIVPYGSRVLVRSIRYNSIQANVKEFGRLLNSEYGDTHVEDMENLLFLDEILRNSTTPIVEILTEEFKIDVPVEDDWYGKR